MIIQKYCNNALMSRIDLCQMLRLSWTPDIRIFLDYYYFLYKIKNTSYIVRDKLMSTCYNL